MAKENRRLVFVLLFALLLHLLSYFPSLIERYYSTGIFPWIGRSFRMLFGWLPFSLGDLLYTGVVCWLAWLLFRFIKKRFTKGLSLKNLGSPFKRGLSVACILYIFFKLSWGLNYNRLGIRANMNLQVPEHYSTGELQALTRDMLLRTNHSRLQLGDSLPELDVAGIFEQAREAYRITEAQLPFLRYRAPSIKVPLWNELGNYLGYGGYFNPFTHEAQVHTHVPVFLLPFTVCHEMAHQLGYASEDEANFVGYLTASNAPDPLFAYSVNFAMYRYANRELWFRDSTLAIANYNALDTLVKQDYQHMIRFYESYENPLEPLVTSIYHQYLIANDQPQGLDTYNQVTAFLLAYRRSSLKGDSPSE